VQRLSNRCRLDTMVQLWSSGLEEWETVHGDVPDDAVYVHTKLCDGVNWSFFLDRLHRWFRARGAPCS
jgi:hypothetical protein